MKEINNTDPYFKVTANLRGCTPDPIGACWVAQHVCVSENIYPSEDQVPDGAINALIKEANIGHWSVFRHAYASFSIEGFPHDAAMQWRTHRASNILTQSQRYTGQRFVDLYWHIQRNYDFDVTLGYIHELFYVPQIGSKIVSRDGQAGEFTKEMYAIQIEAIIVSVEKFHHLHIYGLPFEKCRSVLAPCYRQAWVITATYTDLMHLMDQRLMADTQDTARIAAQMMLKELIKICPEIWSWYEKNRAGKARLSP